MRHRLTHLALAGALSWLLMAPGVVDIEERPHDPRSLDDIPGIEAQGYSVLANPARGMRDRVVTALSNGEHPRINGRISPQFPDAFSPSDRLVRYENRHLNLGGSRITRFLSLEIWINCGDDSRLEEFLGVEGGAATEIINDTLERICSPLTFNDVRNPSQKNDLRERIIIELNEAFDTSSIRDIYYNSFIVF